MHFCLRFCRAEYETCKYKPTITVELTIKMKTKFTSSNAENTKRFISPQMSNFTVFVSAWLFCCLVPPVLTSYSVGDVAGRSHGPGCTAASGTGANQWLSLLDSLAPAHVDREFRFESAVFQLAHSLGEWSLFWTSLTSFYYAAMHCRYFAETKTLWKHLNSSADVFQFGAVETVLF